jgi:PTS system mannose-specific IID component
MRIVNYFWGRKKLNKSILFKIFLRSFFIHTTLNFRRMQNLGFAMAVIPVIREWNLSVKEAAGLLTRHLQMFNTHPYFTGPVLGSVVRLEEKSGGGEVSDSIMIKQSLMGPYAAIGDTFFWGALRPFAAIVACVLAYAGYLVAPLAFLLLYTPSHLWVRLKGFIEGYKRGKQGIEFIRMMDLPRIAVRIRWISLIVLAGPAAFLFTYNNRSPFIILSDVMMMVVAAAIILVCLLLIKKRISQFYILYGAAIIFLLLSLKEI